MRFPALICLFLATSLSPLAVGAPSASFVHVWPGYRSETSFQRIREFFAGKDAPKKEDGALRTQAGSRAGYYFTTRVKADTTVSGAILVVEFLLPDTDEPQVHFFTLDLKSGSNPFLVGVTGKDWPDASTTPTAWQVRLLGTDGKELARERSQLWELPPSRRQPRVTIPGH
ncbi:hypothetical protein OpiT1DRAFT_02718 [Opitutaceae bacterium TAV1]|nr:hypothetical protein OpiT1DRAFT_02718 [Opitutaceae bacterium TAV1]